LVQNWPPPRVKEPTSSVPIVVPRSAAADGVTTTGLRLDSSPKNGTGSGRRSMISSRARPPLTEPVKPTARIAGWATRSAPACRPCTMPSVPSGAPALRAAASRTSKTSCEVAGCEPCALTRTGQPAASAEAVSPPGTEKASGKLLAPKTATGPIGTSIRRRSGRGPIGVSPAESMAASR
jgi:hypothetical protein